MKNRKNKNFPVLLLVAGGILLIFAAVLLTFQNNGRLAVQPSPIANEHDEETYPEIKRVPLDKAKAALEAGTAVFIDVRGAEVYAMSHITGSLSIPLADIEARLGELDANQWIITYCT